jgi:3-dehydroquinate dehydratase
MAKWADPSERCREIARREREIYGQQELPDLLEHMAEENAKLRAEAANSAAQRDEAEKRAEVLTKQKRDLALDVLAADGQAQEAYEAQLAAQTALHAILTARNITEARKIARDALGEE